MKREIHALLPRFSSQLGHIFHYHRAVENAANLIDWTYTAYIPQKTEIVSLPKNWIPILANDTSNAPKNLWLKLKFFIANLFPLRRIFRTIETNLKAIVFIEHFEIQHLASIAFTLFFARPQFHFWILYRYELEEARKKTWLYRLFLSFMRWKLGKDKVLCLTDSELLAKSLQKDLECPLLTVPIPHTEKYTAVKKEKEDLQFWWPGGLIRKDKGLLTIGKILASLEAYPSIKIIAAESSRKHFASYSQINFIPTLLPRAEYVQWMQRADLILLPYSGKEYAKRTSGIFVEAISLGAIPVTTKGTWMAYELEKFGLSSLVFDWNEPNLLDLLCNLLSNDSLKNQLEIMQAHYRRFHSLEGFAKTLELITADS